jgi:hypothetical protein
VVVEQIKEDEGLQNLTEVGGAHQTGDGTVILAARALGDLPPKGPGN